MAEISLSAYQDKLASLLDKNEYDAVIAHSRHILRDQPKNLRAYEQLGRALVKTSRWAEAADVLRRLLGARPSDFDAHAELAGAYRQLGQFERAIWHAERALDQQPNDQAAISLIRDLYRRSRNQEIDRLQLTAGALAQQHIRGNLLQEALNTLDEALERRPERIDLRLLRARALWLDGQRMEAAETAVDILELLPYAIDANRIMTELWLMEQRPSDAQPYLQRIEELDPYLAHQLAAGETAPPDLVTLEELDTSGITPREQAIVDPNWLDTLGDDGGEQAGAGGLGTLLGMNENEAESAEETITADLDDLLSDEQIESLFSELVTGEPVAAVSEVQRESRLEELLTNMEEDGFLAQPDAAADAANEEHPLADELDAIVAQLDTETDDAPATDPTDLQSELDGDLANLLEELDAADEDSGWMAEIQQGGLSAGENGDSLTYMDDFDREWIAERDSEEAGGAPWLSAALREAIDKDENGEFDLFGDDEQLQNLLNETSDTEPIHLSDIKDWLDPADGGGSSERDERFTGLDEELLHAPPARSWLDDEDGDVAPPPEDDPNQRNAELIESWQSELGADDDDDDPYVDWLRDEPDALGDELSALAAAGDEALPANEKDSTAALETARAWGLDDPDQLADFVGDSAATNDAAPDWINAVVPGLDRENDAAPDDANEFARPMAATGKEFAWVSDIVEEETGQMKAIEPAEPAEALYFRFSKPPAWLLAMQSDAQGSGLATGAASLSLDHDIEALKLDDLTFDDYFNFDTPTDKMNAIHLDEDTAQLNFVGLNWDDYFDLESPTEKTIAITLDEGAADLEFNALGIDDDDFDFDADEDKTSAAAETGADLLDNFDLDDASQAQDRPTWLDYDDLSGDFESDDSNRRSGQSTL